MTSTDHHGGHEPPCLITEEGWVQLECHRSHRGSWTVITVLGDLDLAGAPRLRSEVVEVVAGGRHHVVLDLTAVDFVDSAGLGTVVGALRRTRSHDGDLRVVCPEPRLRRVFELCDLDRVFELHTDVDGAVDAPVVTR